MEIVIKVPIIATRGVTKVIGSSRVRSDMHTSAAPKPATDWVNAAKKTIINTGSTCVIFYSLNASHVD